MENIGRGAGGRGNLARLRWPVLGLLLAAVLHGAAAAAAAQTYQFNIEPQPLNQALQLFSDQSGLQIVYHTELLPDAKATSLEGAFDAQTALNRLLKGTRLVAQSVNARTFAISFQPGAAGGGAHTVRPLRVADERTAPPLLAAADTPEQAQAGGPQESAPASAATADTGGSHLEEVLVTAQKRAENVQTVPIAITAFSEADLRNKGITDIHGLSRLTPNVNLDEGSPFSGSNSVLSASIRGIGQDDFAFNLDPGVGVYVDGIYYARTVGANQNLLDVERVEILKGPQGTLFGRNTIGGAISIVTRAPKDELSVEAQVTAGRYDRRDVALMADIPLADTLLSTVTFSSQYRNGYQDRIPYPSPVPYVSDPVGALHSSGTEAFDTQGGQNEQVMRGKLQWKPTDALTATFTADWTHTNQPSTASTVLQTITSGPVAVFGAFYNACVAGIMFVPTAPLVCGPRGVVGTSLWQADLNPATYRLPYGPAVTQTGNIDTTYANGQNFDKLDSYGGALTLDYILDPQFTVRSITGWRRLHWTSGLDADGSPIDFFELSFAEGQHQVSQELQLIGDLLDSRLKLVGGLYFFNEGGYIHDFVTFGGGLLQVDGPNTLNTTSYAGYLHLDYRLTDQIGLTLGGRESEDRKSFTGGQQDLNDFFYKIAGCYPPNSSASLIGAPANLTCLQALGFTNPANPEQVYPYGENHQNFTEFTPTAGFQYHFNQDLMTYFSYAKGFKTGGWTTRLTAPLPPGSPAPSFGPETDKTYEIGLKSEWLDQQLIINAAAFYSLYDGIQLTYQISTSPTTANAGNAEIKGFELEFQSLLGTYFALNGSLGYLDARYTEISPFAVATTGPELPKTPKIKAALSPEAHTRLANGAALRAGVDFTHTGQMFNDVQNTPLLARPKVDMIDASGSYISPSGKVTLTLGGTNLTDKRFITTGQPQFAGGVVFGTYNAPREWYITLGIKL
jgi:iron complex outermembrane recepter protein